MSWQRGFSQYTPLPNCMPIIEAGAWWWFGVATKTTSICFWIWSNMRR